MSSHIVVKPEEFDATKLSFKAPESMNIKNVNNMQKIPILYDNKILVLQTPIFERCSVREFSKKSDTDKAAVVFYQNVR
jgi:hypothetical protein